MFTLIHHVSTDAKKLFFFKGYFSAFFTEVLFDRAFSYFHARSVPSAKPFDSFLSFTPATLFYLTGAALLSFMNFSVQASIPARSTDTLFRVKRRNLRSVKPPVIGLRGYRIRLHGRFSRKQIAAAYHFQEGAMPLSSMDSKVDYGFATIALRNSAVGIKVWLYKSGSPELSELNYTFI